MSLQIWLPLNGNLNNIGVSDLVFSNVATSSTVSSASGKVGACYYNNSHSAGGIISDKQINLGTKQSMFCWVKPDEFYSTASLTGVGGQHRYAKCTGMGITLRYVSSTTGRVSVNTGDGNGNRTYNTYYGNTILTAGNWYHIGYTYDGSTITLYVNGVKDGTHSIAGMACPSDYIHIFGWSLNGTSGDTIYTDYKFKGYINDFRIYDHCLSAKEVKEISKGLVLHYPLSDPYLESTANYSSQGAGVGGWNNSGSSTRNSNDTSLARIFTNSPVISILQTAAGNSAFTFGMVQTSTYPAIKGAKVTASVYTYISDVNCSANTVYLRSTVNDNKAGNEICVFSYNGSTNPQSWPKNQWIRISGTGTVVSDETSVYFCTYTNNLNEKRYFTGWQLEIKDHTTPFVDGSRDEATVYDCSGLRNNGTASESLPTVLSSPRYEKCYYFNSTSKRITLPTISMTGFANSFSISWWGKAPSYSGLMYWGFSNGNRLNFYDGRYCNTGDGGSNPYYKPNTTTTIDIPSVNVWHHFVMVGDGTSNKLYMDGALYGVAKTYKGITGSSIVINGWDSSTNYKTNGYISDFRIYSTALSADDVRELYNASASIDKSGNIYAYEFREE